MAPFCDKVMSIPNPTILRVYSQPPTLVKEVEMGLSYADEGFMIVACQRFSCILLLEPNNPKFLEILLVTLRFALRYALGFIVETMMQFWPHFGIKLDNGGSQ